MAAFGKELTRAPAKRGPSAEHADYAREFEAYLESTIRQHINYLSRVSLTSGRLQREIAELASIFPDSSRLTDFACEECGKPLVHHLRHGADGDDFFGCSGCLDGCMSLYDNLDGRPIRSA
ncbi:hypothetical protein H6CHR_05493 [Variovorax sp. PBL-H6]|uniref:hypothetical protein n=1 Tax=Variovorax sp. PBL-H6 TaxID=434009 RepID=UPI0013197136|nr:hypothetical protein [Variovorax sp. PBL-H6]VTU39470.1 hypothetical protein H6CHR_05493 [Variovorax sp. PBL-H6]